MILTKMIYIASPYTSKSGNVEADLCIQEARFHTITEVIGRLQDKYDYAFIGPITQSHCTAKYMTKKCVLFASWAKRDLTYISRCDEVWVITMDGWMDSTGVKAEIKFAKKNSIPIKYIDPNTFHGV